MPDFVWSIKKVPCGCLGLVSRGETLVRIYFKTDEAEVSEAVDGAYPQATQGSNSCLDRVAGQIDEYFAGRRACFDLPLDRSGLSPFSLRVYDALSKVPAGQQVTYSELAARAGSPGAARAVGGVMAKNPYAIVVPCHRVVAASGAPGGYSGGAGYESKTWLLEFEKSFSDI